jgi:hypothetical protein
MEKVFDISYIVVIEMATILATISNFSSAKIFSNGEFKNEVFRYLAFNSVIDGMITILVILFPFIEFVESSVVPESLAKSYFIKIYELYVVYYLMRILGLVSALISLKVSFDRLLLLIRSNRKMVKRTHFQYVILLFFFISIFVYSPKMFFMRVTKSIVVNGTRNTALTYQTYTIQIDQKSVQAKLSHSLGIVVPLGTTVFMNIVNLTLIISSYCIIQVLKNRRRPLDNLAYETNVNKATFLTLSQQRILYMVIWITILNPFHQYFMFYSILHRMIYGKSYIYRNRYVTSLIHFVFIFSHSANAIVYCIFDKKFASHFQDRILFDFCKNSKKPQDCENMILRPRVVL